jgi:hypothetical protein
VTVGKMVQRWPLAVVVAGLLGACAEDKSFVVVSVVADTGQGMFNDVAQLRVGLRNGAHRDTLHYPKMATAMVRFDEAVPLTFSVGLKPARAGDLVVGVTPLNAGGTVLGYGQATATIVVGNETSVTVKIRRDDRPPPDEVDGGAAGDGGAGDRPDARTADAGPPCDPTMAMSCPGGGTCAVSCLGTNPTSTCTMGGTKRPGEICTRTEDCAAGGQCFSLTCGGTQVPRSCLKFCNTDADCGGGKCRTEVPCMGRPSGFKLCTQACDPTGEATTGCAMGLSCFLYSGEVPDCDCRGPERTGAVGARCTDSSTCNPGLFCVTRGGDSTCRPLCKLSDMRCPAGMVCNRLVSPDFSTYGECSSASPPRADREPGRALLEDIQLRSRALKP